MPYTISRRASLRLMAVSAVAHVVSPRPLAAQSTSSAPREDRIRRIIRAFEEQGFHRTGTSVDRGSANWLRDEARQVGLAASLEPFSLQRVDTLSAALIGGGRRVEGIPLFDAAFTNEQGVQARFLAEPFRS